MYDLVKRYYNLGLFEKRKVYLSVGAKWITPEQYEEITGEVYVAPQR